MVTPQAAFAALPLARLPYTRSQVLSFSRSSPSSSRPSPSVYRSRDPLCTECLLSFECFPNPRLKLSSLIQYQQTPMKAYTPRQYCSLPPTTHPHTHTHHSTPPPTPSPMLLRPPPMLLRCSGWCSCSFSKPTGAGGIGGDALTGAGGHGLSFSVLLYSYSIMFDRTIDEPLQEHLCCTATAVHCGTHTLSLPHTIGSREANYGPLRPAQCAQRVTSLRWGIDGALVSTPCK